MPWYPTLSIRGRNPTKLDSFRDLVQADREGSWMLHLHSVQTVLSLFAGCDRVNYLRWGSVYLEDMRQLPEKAQSVFKNFKAGKFAVKRTNGRFVAAGADMCLEQTINHRQKSASGIIGNTKKEQFVAQWKMIHHEMLTVVHRQRKQSGIQLANTELLVNYEFNKPATLAAEANVQGVIHYITEHMKIQLRQTLKAVMVRNFTTSTLKKLCIPRLAVVCYILNQTAQNCMKHTGQKHLLQKRDLFLILYTRSRTISKRS